MLKKNKKKTGTDINTDLFETDVHFFTKSGERCLVNCEQLDAMQDKENIQEIFQIYEI